MNAFFYGRIRQIVPKNHFISRAVNKSNLKNFTPTLARLEVEIMAFEVAPSTVSQKRRDQSFFISLSPSRKKSAGKTSTPSAMRTKSRRGSK